MSNRGRSRGGLIALAFTAGFLCLLGWRCWRLYEQGDRDRELARVHHDLAAGRLDSAGQRLSRLKSRWPEQPDVQYALGAHAAAVGDSAVALDALARVPAGFPHAADAALLRARILGEQGRFAEAEPLLQELVKRSGPIGREARQRLAEIWQWQIRPLDIRRLLREGFDQLPDPATTLRDLWLIEAEPIPVAGIRTVLDRAREMAPEDDRVWLGQANLAIESGQYQEAERLLEACLARRRDDHAVWHSWFRLARASDRPIEAWKALSYLPAALFDPAEVLAIRAWLAASRGVTAAERAALEKVVEIAPGNQPALSRLAELEVIQGRAEPARRLRRLRAEAETSRLRFRQLILSRDASSADELARLASFMGRHFDADRWSEIARRFPSDSQAARALPAAPARATSIHRPGETLADLLADLNPARTSSETALAAARPLATTANFVDDAERVGLHFVYHNGQSPKRQLPETSGGGVGLLDYDGDGWLDVYLVQGGPFPPEPASTLEGDRLFRNRGDGSFENVTEASGIAGMRRGYGHGVTVGDFDNDGHPDLFITRWKSYALYRNRGDGRFEDVTEMVGLGGDRDWPTSAAFADLDHDGDLDLYVCHYLKWDARDPKICQPMSGSTVPTYCHPHELQALSDHLFRNDHGVFVDVTAEAGIMDTDGRGLGVIASDLDADRKLDLVVANDTTANFFFHNLGGLKFEEIGLSAGVACNAAGGFQAGMGVACGDLDQDGYIDVAVTNFYAESTSLFKNLGNGLFVDRTTASGLGAASRFLLGFGVAFLDFDNDGRLDLTSSNGHVNDFRPHIPYEMPAQLLAGDGQGRLKDVSSAAGAVWQVPRVGRGLSIGDLDNDGRIDTVLVSQNSPVAYFHNRTPSMHFLTLKLEGTSSNRDAVGASIVVTSGGRRQVTQRFGGGSFLSASDPRLHFGLGEASRVDLIEVTWPSGRVDLYRDLAADNGYRLREGEADAQRLLGFAARDPSKKTVGKR